MDFAEADKLSATSDNQFILDLMPKYPIYVDLLPEAARAVVGQCHAEGVGARRLLEWEGFRFGNVVDIFDGGPLFTAARDSLRTAREAQRVKAAADGARGKRGLIALADVARFRCAPARLAVEDGAALVAPEVLTALKAQAGEPVLAWSGDE
jgi:arginine N-succinyltransferase